MKADSLLMKEMNKNTIRKELKRLRRATKPELAAKTGLSVVTVNSLVEEMREEGEVLLGDTVPSGGGRPSVQYLYNALWQLAVTVYGHQQRDKIRLCLSVVNLFGECLERKRRFLEEVKEDTFEEWLDEAFVNYPSIRLIVFGLPGEEKDGVIFINDYPDLVGDTFLRHYREKYRVPVLFENDINAAILGYSFRREEVTQNLVGIYFPTVYPPGAGVVMQGGLYHGLCNFAGELQYIELPYRWEEMDYTDTEQVAEMAGRLLVMYGCILAPDTVVLYGDFWTEEHQNAVREYVKRKLGEDREMMLVFEDSPDKDFERGMIKLALDGLEKKLL